MVEFISAAIPRSLSVVLRPDRYSGGRYDIELRDSPRVGMIRLIAGPVLLGKLMNQAQGFVYVGKGYLLDLDYREFEFSFLRKHGLSICCYWTGSDIRSNRLMHETEARTGVPNISTYIGFVDQRCESDRFDIDRQLTAMVADRYASVMFLHPHANRNYLARPVEPFLYLFPDDRFQGALSKYDDLSVPVIVHAPSSPLIKGTPLVRAAIAHLRLDGYRFDYVELIGVSNDVVLESLARAHISLGHFYGFTPGIYGIESLAAATALLISADEFMEPYLPAGSNDAWLVTKHDQVYENLKALLDAPELLAPLALRGQAWARRNFSASANGPTLLAILDSVLERSYPSSPRP